MFKLTTSVQIAPSLLESGETTGIVKGNYVNESIASGAKVLIVELPSPGEGYEVEQVTEFCRVLHNDTVENAIITEDAAPFLEEYRSGAIDATYRIADAVLDGSIQLNANGDMFAYGGMLTGDNMKEFMEVLDDSDMSTVQKQGYLSAHPLNVLAMGAEEAESIHDLVNISPDVAAAWDKGNDTFKEIINNQRYPLVCAVVDPDDHTLDVYEGIHLGTRQDDHGRTGHVAMLRDHTVEFYDDLDNVIPVASIAVPIEDLSMVRKEFGFTPDEDLVNAAGELKLIHESVSDRSMLEAIGERVGLFGGE